MKPCEHGDKTKAEYDLLIEPLREVARVHGYALAVHGSLIRDIDLIAVPWSETCSDALTLATAIKEKAAELSGIAFMSPGERDNEFFENGCPGMKPHGRYAWCFHLGGGPYIDLAIMPRFQDWKAWTEKYGDQWQ